MKAKEQKTVTLDVREDIRNGREPFSKIMGAVARLRPDENLLLLAPFEPKPLFGILANQGFDHSARETDNGDWDVLFRRRRGDEAMEPKTENSISKKSSVAPATTILDVDARRLEPPQPMVKILEALAALPEGAELRAHTDRRPMHLYAQLEARGFNSLTEEQSDGSFITHIRAR